MCLKNITKQVLVKDCMKILLISNPFSITVHFSSLKGSVQQKLRVVKNRAKHWVLASHCGAGHGSCSSSYILHLSVFSQYCQKNQSCSTSKLSAANHLLIIEPLLWLYTGRRPISPSRTGAVSVVASIREGVQCVWSHNVRLYEFAVPIFKNWQIFLFATPQSEALQLLQSQ